MGSGGSDLQLVFPLLFFLWAAYLPLFRTVRHCYQTDRSGKSTTRTKGATFIPPSLAPLCCVCVCT
jgi:hypothetical protein